MGSRRQGYNTVKKLAGDHLVSSFDTYANLRTLLKFKCIDCLTEFVNTGHLYLKSLDARRCQSCKKMHKVNSKDDREEFIRRCKVIHGDYYDYSMVEYSFNEKDKITLICPKHGKFSMPADVHLSGSGCSKCKIDYITGRTRSSTTEFILKANEIHKNRYGYRLVEYHNATTPVSIECIKHGVFQQRPDVHLGGSGCPQCKSSVVMQQITKMLDSHDISYSLEKSFEDLRGFGGRRLRFDLYIPGYNLLVEYDSPYHYLPIHGKDTLEKQQAHDSLKDNYCDTNNYNLIRIPYTEPNPDTLITQYLLANRDIKRHTYTWKDLQEDLHRLSNYIKTFKYDKFAIYAIIRGGLLFTVPLTYHFEGQCEFGQIMYQRYDGNDKKAVIVARHTRKDIPIFIIDDLISSGTTMKKAVKALRAHYRKVPIHPVVIFGEENDQDIFFLREHPKKWIQFPYEL